MLSKVVALVALIGIASAASVPQAPCFGETYRCDATGWQLQALCAKPSCAHDPDQKVPHCYDH